MDGQQSQNNEFGSQQHHSKGNSRNRKVDSRNRNRNRNAGQRQTQKTKTGRVEDIPSNRTVRESFENKGTFGEDNTGNNENGKNVMINLKRGFTLGGGRKSTFQTGGKQLTANEIIHSEQSTGPKNRKGQVNRRGNTQRQPKGRNPKENAKQDKRRQNRSQNRPHSKNARLKNSGVLGEKDLNRVRKKDEIAVKSKHETAPTEIVTEDENADNETVRDENDEPKATQSRGRTHLRKQNQPISKQSKRRSKNKQSDPKLERPIDKILQKLNIAMGKNTKNKTTENQQNSNFGTNKDKSKRPSKSILRKSTRKRKSSQNRDSLRFENLNDKANLHRRKSNKNGSNQSGNQTPAFAFGSDQELSSTRDQIGSESSGINKREKNLMDLLKRLGAKSNPARPESERAEMDNAQIKGWFERVWVRIRRVKQDEEENGEYQRIKKEIIEKKQMSSKQIVRINSTHSCYFYFYFYLLLYL